jgi:CPA2 family monovalent cation:H+ antiporter-2
MIEIALMINPRVETVVRTHSEDEAALLRKESAGRVFLGEHELANSMAAYVLERVTAR